MQSNLFRPIIIKTHDLSSVATSLVPLTCKIVHHRLQRVLTRPCFVTWHCLIEQEYYQHFLGSDRMFQEWTWLWVKWGQSFWHSQNTCSFYLGGRWLEYKTVELLWVFTSKPQFQEKVNRKTKKKEVTLLTSRIII